MTRYLLDTQPGLALVIAQTTGANTERYIHAPRGVHAIENQAGNWSYMLQDGLGSVRGEISASGTMLGSRSHAPYGTVSDSDGTFSSSFGYAGEQIDDSGLSYNRNRYYNSQLGNWISLDPLETNNRYAYVSGNSINATDASGLQSLVEFQYESELGCNFVTKALEKGSLSHFISTYPESIFGEGCAAKENAIALIGANYIKCSRSTPDIKGLEVPLRLFLSGSFNLNTMNQQDLASHCPEAFICAPCDNSLRRSPSFIQAIRKCFPIENTPCTNRPINIFNQVIQPIGVEFLPPEFGGVTLPEEYIPPFDDGNAFKRVMIGLRFDLNLELITKIPLPILSRPIGGDVNLELQLIPHHLQPKYWGKETILGVVFNYGMQRSFGVADIIGSPIKPNLGGGAGIIIGMINAPDHSIVNGLAAPSETYAVGGQVVVGGGLAGDITYTPQTGDIYGYGGLAGGVKAPSIYGIKGQSIFIDPAVVFIDFLERYTGLGR